MDALTAIAALNDRVKKVESAAEKLSGQNEVIAEDRYEIGQDCGKDKEAQKENKAYRTAIINAKSKADSG